MAEQAVKDAVLAALDCQTGTLPGLERPTVIVGENLEEVRTKLNLDPTLSNTKLGKALRSLHCKGIIRCARPRRGLGERRPYEVTLLTGGF